jgi:hypothetical protein
MPPDRDAGPDRVGLGLCLVSAAGFGSLAIFGKQAYAGGLGVAGVLALRFVLAAPLLVGLALVARRRLRVGWPVALRLLGLGGVGYAIQARCSSTPWPASRPAWPPRCCTCTRPLPVQCVLVSACWLVPLLGVPLLSRG